MFRILTKSSCTKNSSTTSRLQLLSSRRHGTNTSLINISTPRTIFQRERIASSLQSKSSNLFLYHGTSTSTTRIIINSSFSSVSNQCSNSKSNNNNKPDIYASPSSNPVPPEETSPVASKKTPKILKRQLDSISSELQNLKNYYDLIYWDPKNHYNPQSFMTFTKERDRNNSPNSSSSSSSIRTSSSKWHCEFICPITSKKFTTSDAVPSKKVAKKILCSDILNYWDIFFAKYYELCYNISEKELLEECFRYNSMEALEEEEWSREEGVGKSTTRTRTSTLYTCQFTCPISQQVFKTRGGYDYDILTGIHTSSRSDTRKSSSADSYYTTSNAAKRNVCSQVLSSLSSNNNNNALLDVSSLLRVSHSTSLLQQQRGLVQYDFTCPIIPTKHFTTTIPTTSSSTKSVLLENKEKIRLLLDTHWTETLERYYALSNLFENNLTYSSDEEKLLLGCQMQCPLTHKIYFCDHNAAVQATRNGIDKESGLGAVISEDEVILELKRNVMWQILVDNKESLIQAYNQPSTQQSPQTPKHLSKETNFREAVTITTHEEQIHNGTTETYYNGTYTCPLTNQTFRTKLQTYIKTREQVYLDISSMTIESWKYSLFEIYQRHGGISNIMDYFTYESCFTGGDDVPTWVCSFTCPLREDKVYKGIPYPKKKNMSFNSLLPSILAGWNSDHTLSPLHRPSPEHIPSSTISSSIPISSPQQGRPIQIEEIDTFYESYNISTKFKDAIKITPTHPELSISNEDSFYNVEYTCPLTNKIYKTSNTPTHTNRYHTKEEAYLDIVGMVVHSWKDTVTGIYQRNGGISNIENYFTFDSQYSDEDTPPSWVCSFTCPLRNNKVYKSTPYPNRNMAYTSILPIILSDWNTKIFWNVDSKIVLSTFYSELLEHIDSFQGSIALDDHITNYTNSKIKLRGGVSSHFIDFICPLTNQTYKNTPSASLSSGLHVAKGLSYHNNTSFYSKEEAMLNILLQVLSTWEDKILLFYNQKNLSLLSEEKKEDHKNFGSMLTCDKSSDGDKNWLIIRSFVCPLTEKEYFPCTNNQSNNNRLLAKVDIIKQILVDYKDELLLPQLPIHTNITVKNGGSLLLHENVVVDPNLNVITEPKLVSSTQTEEDCDEGSSFVLQSIPTASPMELILQAWNDDSNTKNKNNQSSPSKVFNNKYNATTSPPTTLQNKEDEAHIKANNMLLWMSNHTKLNPDNNYTNPSLSSSSYIQILEALSQVYNLPYNITSPPPSKRKQRHTTNPNNNNILLNSLDQVQIMAGEVLKNIQEQQEDIPTDVYNTYLKCLRNENAIRIAEEAESIQQLNILNPNKETFKIFMKLWNDVPSLSKVKNQKIMESVILNGDVDSKRMIDKEMLLLALESLVVDDSSNGEDGWDINLAKWYIEQAEHNHDSSTTILDVDVLNAPLKTHDTSTVKSNACMLRTAEQAEEWLTYMQSIDNDDVGTNIAPNSETYSHIMKAWCKVESPSYHGLKRAEEMAQQLLQLQPTTTTAATIDPKLFYPLLEAYANNTSSMYNGLSRIEKWVDIIGTNEAGYYAIQALGTHFQNIQIEEHTGHSIEQQQLSSHLKWVEQLHCANNCKDWALKLQDCSLDDGCFDISFIHNILKIWGHKDILKSLPEDGKEILIFLLDLVLQQLQLPDKPVRDDNKDTTLLFTVLDELITSICHLDMDVEQHSDRKTKRNGFHLLFPQIERVLHQLDTNKSYNHNSIQSTTPMSNSSTSDMTTGSITEKDESISPSSMNNNKSQAIIGFYISLLKGCKILTTDPQSQGDAIRITMKVIHKIFPSTNNTSMYNNHNLKSISEEDRMTIMKDIISISNNLQHYKEQFLEGVMDVILLSSNQTGRVHSQSQIKSCLDVIADAKKMDGYSNRNYYGARGVSAAGRNPKRVMSNRKVS